MSLRFQTFIQQYPSQFWLMFTGMLLSTVGASMIWPFLMIYVSGKLQLPLAQVASLFTINATAGLIASFLAGPIIDRYGRKTIMVLSLISNGLVYLMFSRATGLGEFAILMALSGASSPLYRVGGDAMLADLVPPEKRPDAYALLRMSNNIGVAIGPAVGGFIASASYAIAFYCAAAGLSAYGLLLAFLARETLPLASAVTSALDPPNKQTLAQSFAGYGQILKNRTFMTFVLGFILISMSNVLAWVLMPVYAKNSFGIPENRYGFIPTTNALMVVFFQVSVTNFSKRRAPLRVMTLGGLLYALGVGSIAFFPTIAGWWGFWSSMVIITLGELLLMPTSSTFAANLAPAHMRGRYMSVYGLGWPVASGIAPVLGGLLSDNLGPETTWYGGLVMGLLGSLVYWSMSQTSRRVSFRRRRNP